MLLIIRQALWRNPWCLFFRFEEKYDDAIFTSDPVFCLTVPYPMKSIFSSKFLRNSSSGRQPERLDSKRGLSFPAFFGII